MAARSPEGQHRSPAGSEHVEEAPTAEAELKILMFPVDGAVPETADSDGPRNWLAALLRRAGLTFHARMTVPLEDAGEMLATVRKIGLAVTWAVTVLVTLAVTLPAGVPVPAVIAVIAIELAGFAAGALSTRRKRPGKDT
jgi:hypothetical protein